MIRCLETWAKMERPPGPLRNDQPEAAADTDREPFICNPAVFGQQMEPVYPGATWQKVDPATITDDFQPLHPARAGWAPHRM